MNNRDDVLPFIANDRFESNGDPKFSEFIGEEERVGVGSAPDQQLSADGDGFCGKLVCLVHLVYLVHLVCLVDLVHLVSLAHPTKQTKQTKETK